MMVDIAAMPLRRRAALVALHRIAALRPNGVGWPEGAACRDICELMENIALTGLTAAGCDDFDLDSLDRHHAKEWLDEWGRG